MEVVDGGVKLQWVVEGFWCGMSTCNPKTTSLHDSLSLADTRGVQALLGQIIPVSDLHQENTY